MSELQNPARDLHRPVIDFEAWAALARSDPVAFEEKRVRAIEKAIQAMPEPRQQRLRRLQWKIDRVRARCGTPMSACIKLSGMMWDSLVGPGGLKDWLERLGGAPAEPLPEARVLQLNPRSHR